MTSLIGRLVGAFSPRAEADPLYDGYYTSDSSAFGSSLAGVAVSSDSAMKQFVFYRCVSIRAQTFAGLPIGVYRKKGKTRTELTAHPLARAFSRPNPWQSPFEYRRQIAWDWLVRGNAYSQISFEPDGRLVLVRLDPDRVREVTKEGDRVRTYEYRKADGRPVTLVGDRDVWHIQAMGGKGLLELAREQVANALSAEAHTARFLKRGVKFSGVLQHPGTLKPDVAKEMSSSFSAQYGGVSGAGRTPVLWSGMEYKPTAMTHHDAQFLETYREGLTGIATYCGVPPYMVGLIDKQTSWGTGVEEQKQGFVDFTVGPDCIHFEQDSDRVFLDGENGRGGLFSKHNMNALLRGRTKDRFDVYAIGIDKHIMTPNECRALEEMDPIEGGDEFPAVPGAQVGTEAPEKPGEDAPAKPKVVKAEGAPIPTFAYTEEQWRVLSSGTSERLQHLAAWVASELLNAEARDMAEIAKTTATDSAKWANAVKAYFGNRPARVVESLSITESEARAYCKEQAKAAAEGGAKVLESWTRDHAGRVIALAMGTSTTTGKE